VLIIRKNKHNLSKCDTWGCNTVEQQQIIISHLCLACQLLVRHTVGRPVLITRAHKHNPSECRGLRCGTSTRV
jgi:hypothetical protein